MSVLLKKLSRDWRRNMMLKYMELPGDMSDWKVMKAKNCRNTQERRREKKGQEKKKKRERKEDKKEEGKEEEKKHNFRITLFFSFLHTVGFISIIYFHIYIYIYIL